MWFDSGPGPKRAGPGSFIFYFFIFCSISTHFRAISAPFRAFLLHSAHFCSISAPFLFHFCSISVPFLFHFPVPPPPCLLTQVNLVQKPPSPAPRGGRPQIFFRARDPRVPESAFLFFLNFFFPDLGWSQYKAAVLCRSLTRNACCWPFRVPPSDWGPEIHGCFFISPGRRRVNREEDPAGLWVCDTWASTGSLCCDWCLAAQFLWSPCDVAHCFFY